MFQETEALFSGDLQPASGLRAPWGSPAHDAPAQAAETPEQEIARLTWSVLDGGASLTHRQRLAELVNSQHARRARRDAS